LDNVGLLGCGPSAKDILEGTYNCPTDADEYTKLFIEALHWPAIHLDQVSAILSPENFCAHWRQVKESTSSSILGLHFGHYKAAIHDHLLAHLHMWFTQLVFMLGISLTHYQSGLQVVLEKKAGAIHIDLLWAILLMEANINAAMKLIIGHCMICKAFKARAIPDECFRS